MALEVATSALSCEHRRNSGCCAQCVVGPELVDRLSAGAEKRLLSGKDVLSPMKEVIS